MSFNPVSSSHFFPTSIVAGMRGSYALRLPASRILGVTDRFIQGDSFEKGAPRIPGRASYFSCLLPEDIGIFRSLRTTGWFSWDRQHLPGVVSRLKEIFKSPTLIGHANDLETLIGLLCVPLHLSIGIDSEDLLAAIVDSPHFDVYRHMEPLLRLASCTPDRESFSLNAHLANKVGSKMGVLLRQSGGVERYRSFLRNLETKGYGPFVASALLSLVRYGHVDNFDEIVVAIRRTVTEPYVRTECLLSIVKNSDYCRRRIESWRGEADRAIEVLGDCEATRMVREFYEHIEEIYDPESWCYGDPFYDVMEVLLKEVIFREAAQVEGAVPPKGMEEVVYCLASHLSESFPSDYPSFDVIHIFLRETMTFLIKHPLPANDVGSLFFFTIIHCLLGSDLKHVHERDLRTVVSNLRGYEMFFEEDVAGLLFHRQAQFIAELADTEGKPTGFHLELMRGRNECSTGLRLALIDHVDADAEHPLAQVQFDFGERGVLIDCIQGSLPPSRYLLPEDKLDCQDRLDRLNEMTAGGSAIDLLVVSAVILARMFGFEEAGIIVDDAQWARYDMTALKGRGGGFYNLTARRLGFQPAEKGAEYSRLDLRTLHVYRGELFREGEEVENYVNHVLSRDPRKRPKLWDQSPSDPAAPMVNAFRNIFFPALLSLKLHASPPQKERDEIMSPLPLEEGKEGRPLIDLSILLHHQE